LNGSREKKKLSKKLVIKKATGRPEKKSKTTKRPKSPKSPTTPKRRRKRNHQSGTGSADEHSVI